MSTIHSATLSGRRLAACASLMALAALGCDGRGARTHSRDAAPYDAALCVDSDGDGIGDAEEDYGLGWEDADGDGIPNRVDLDSDADGVSDHDEATASTSNCPRSGGGCTRCLSPRFLTPDSDVDGVPDGYELAAGTDPCDYDSDDDGCPDGLEARGCGGNDVVFICTCDAGPADVVFTLPAPGPSHARVTIELVSLPDELARLLSLETVSSSPALPASDQTFRDVPAGATLVFRINPLPVWHLPGGVDAVLRIVDDAGTIESRPLHLLVPDCCPDR
jgi:hypothetical protein